MLSRGPCLLCGARVGPPAGRFCGDCYADLPLQAAVGCFGCGAPMPVMGPCPYCLAPAPAFDRCIVPCGYRYPVDLMIKQLKYQARLELIPPLSQPLLEQLRRAPVELPECLIPVPLHPTRLHSRGFNQAREIARTLAKELRLPVDEGLLQRHKATVQQYELSPGQRKLNVKNSFSIVKSISYSCVGVVDDIVTTGATAAELARLLKRHGARQVQLWSLAQAAPVAAGAGARPSRRA